MTNILVPTLNSRRRSVYFLPERILIREGKRFAAVAYESLDVAVEDTHFIEDGAVPRDSRQVGTTWRFVNKDGSPDRRYNNNRQLPVMLYGRLTLSNADGFLMIWDFSRPELARDFSHAVRAMARNASAAQTPVQRAPATTERTHPPTQTLATATRSKPFDLWGQRGRHGQDVVGESHYGDALLRIIGGRPSRDWAEVVMPALLVPEPANPYDPNAVAVVIQDNIVGHLPRADAKRYHPVLASLLSHGFVPRVSAQVRGGLTDNGSGLVFIGTVKLDLGEPHLVVPANLPPQTRHVLLPPGRVVQVTGEEAHVEVLAPMAGDAGQRWVYVTLCEVTELTARTSKFLVEVRVNDSPCGRLTQQMSSQLLPAIRYFSERGVITAARAMLKRGPTKTDVALHIAPASDLAEQALVALPVSGEPETPDATTSPQPL